MAVQISELEVIPRAEREQQLQAEQPQGGGGGGQQASSPEQAHEIAQTVALLNARELRLRAD
jgi:hypothetical protein